VEGIVLSPGYSYDKAPDQNRFMGRARVRRLFRAILSNASRIGSSTCRAVSGVPDGRQAIRVHAMGIAGIQHLWLAAPCYLLQDGYAETSRNCWKRQSGKSTAWPAQSQMRQLHGELRVRAHGRYGRFRVVEGLFEHHSRHFQQYLINMH